MAEQIRPSGNVAAGFVSTSRPGPTGLERLADALQGVQKGTKAIFDAVEKQKREQETQEVSALLANPALTKQEAEEIGQNAFFPETRMKVENRIGGIVVDQAALMIEDRLRNAKDVVEARQVLGEFHQDLRDQYGDTPGVQAGIAERLSEVSPRFLREAAARRTAALQQDDLNTMGEAIITSLDNGLPEFDSALKGIISDERFTNSNPDVLRKVLPTALENYYNEGVTSNRRFNINAQRTKKAIDAAKKLAQDPFLDSSLNTLRNRILNDEFRSNNSADSLVSDAQKAEAVSIIGDIALREDEEIIPPEQALEWRRIAKASGDKPTIVAMDKAIDRHNSLAREGTLFNHDFVRNARRQIAARNVKLNKDNQPMMMTSIYGTQEMVISNEGLRQQEIFDAAVRQLDPEIYRDDEQALQNTVTQLLVDLPDLRQTVKDRSAEDQARVKAQGTPPSGQPNVGPTFTPPPAISRKELLQNARARRRQVISEYIIENGLNDREFVRTDTY